MACANARVIVNQAIFSQEKNCQGAGAPVGNSVFTDNPLEKVSNRAAGYQSFDSCSFSIDRTILRLLSFDSENTITLRILNY